MDENISQIAAWSISFEGSITWGKSKKQFQPQIYISNTDKILLEKFRDLVGMGKIYPKNHVYLYKKGWNPQWRWGLNNLKEVHMFLEKIIPYLPSKNERAQLIYNLCDMRLKHKHEPYSDEEKILINKILSLQKSKTNLES